MNYFKKKIVILMLASYAGALCAAAQPEERSLWQRAMDYVAEHPVATGVIGTAAAAGAYELAAHKFGLPTLNNVGISALEKLRTDRKSQVLAAGAAAAGAYSLAAQPLGLPTIIDTIKADLITRSDNADAYPTAFEQLVRQMPGGDSVFPFIPGEDQPVENHAAICHVAHGVRLFFYSLILNNLFYSIISKFPGVSDNRQRLLVSDEPELSKSFVLAAILGAPIFEELTDTYLPNLFFGKWAQLCMPFYFGLTHPQYSLEGKFRCGLFNLLNNRSIYVRPEYRYAPIISHVLHNTIAMGVLYYLRGY